jgi:hypothetical protein
MARPASSLSPRCDHTRYPLFADREHHGDRLLPIPARELGHESVAALRRFISDPFQIQRSPVKGSQLVGLVIRHVPCSINFCGPAQESIDMQPNLLEAVTAGRVRLKPENDA